MLWFLLLVAQMRRRTGLVFAQLGKASRIPPRDRQDGLGLP